MVAGLDLSVELQRALRAVGIRCCCWPGSAWCCGPRRGGTRETVAPATSGGPLARTVQSPAAVVVFIWSAGSCRRCTGSAKAATSCTAGCCWSPLLCLLAPVAVVPVVVPEGTRLSREAGYWLAGGVSALWMSVAGWALWAANSSGLGDDATRVTYTGIVDERRFYAQATGHAHPLTAADYLDYPRMRAILVALNNTPEGALLLPSGNYDQWDLVPPSGRRSHRRTAMRRKRAAHSLFHQPRHGRHERRTGCPGDRPDRAGQSVGGAHRPACSTAGSVTTRISSRIG